ncbi:C40 family peptidase [Paeniglutamicibacter psychrophenolicus]|uniref:C40 family peptidase n=1 Tax=Paeniglutamicibacter psychrophenolicus TaxID=257454 RepID=UPI00278563A8|nr:C40 family peptidase [Paeniglutamicibacter psychrophenolicus]MDQ0094639.1 cell wall-associated NlpC family hydrolase [Paeniglutamicibacter psychrophenolicus]
MSFTDMASRIGAIQGTLARVSGTTASMRPEPLPSGTAAAASMYAGGVAGASSALPAAPSTPAAFTQALQEAMAAPAVLAPKATTPAPAASVAPGTGAAAAKPDAVRSEPQATKGGVDGSDVVAAAKMYLGVPYVWGGNNPKIGLDCSSFVQHTFRDLGVEVPRVARQQAKEGTEVPSLSQAKPGDLIVTRGGGHIGIYLGDNKMIHAPRPGESVSIRKLFETDATIMTIRRIVPSETSVPGAAKPAAGAIQDTVSVQAELTAALQRAHFSTAVNGA